MFFRNVVVLSKYYTLNNPEDRHQKSRETSQKESYTKIQNLYLAAM
jgi:hypothetical protein